MNQNSNNAREVAAASVIGVVAGMRTFTAPAIVSQIARRGGLHLGCPQLQKIGEPAAANTIAILAIGELIGDKLPMTPSRTKLFALIPRILSGAFCGAILCASQKRLAGFGALAGAAGAAGGTFAAFHLRKKIGTSLELPDPAVAVMEDALAIGLGVFAATRAANENGQP